MIKHVLEELWGPKEDDISHKIFTREDKKMEVDDVFTLTKDDLLTLSW